MAGFAIDMFDVGLGDCIAVELSTPLNKRLSVIIDGGSKSAAEDKMSSLLAFHGRNPCVVISTHPDNDHIGGLPQIVEEMKPLQVFLNNPLDLASKSQIANLAMGLDKRTKERLDGALERTELLADAAAKVRAEVLPAFAGRNYTWSGWNIRFLNPQENFYRWLWTTAEGIQDLYVDKTVNESDYLRQNNLSVLDDGTDTTSMNNSSVITLIEGYGNRMLFTGDAGMYALVHAIVLDQNKLRRVDFLDGPHHGSRRNVNTYILQHLAPRITSISASDTDEHPCDEVVATLQHCGGDVFATKHHKSMCFSKGIYVQRSGYNPIEPLPPLLSVPIIRG